MTIGEMKLYGIMTDRLDFLDIDHFFAGLKHFLPWAMTADFGGRRMNAKKFTGKMEGFSIRKRYIQNSGFLVQLDF